MLPIGVRDIDKSFSSSNIRIFNTSSQPVDTREESDAEPNEIPNFKYIDYFLYVSLIIETNYANYVK